MVGLSLDCGFGEDLCSLLEGSGGEEGLCEKGSLCDTEKHGFAFSLLQTNLTLCNALVKQVVLVVEFAEVYCRAGEKRCVALVCNLYLSCHLTSDNLNVLVVDIDTLAAVNLLNFEKDVIVNRVDTADTENIRRVHVALGESSSRVNVLPVFNYDICTERDLVYKLFGAVVGFDCYIVRSLDKLD